ncbi:Protein kinase A anchor protein, nuclear localization signal domain [Dillenia turbinata]|uniref:Protein kinase A anchor protein, nuclear localization signal domain n=1 Tax=Dillenia turbinata TaxID=194707 RepID=A0AAN8UB11_9MAGN
MLACTRSFFRADRTWKFANSYATLNLNSKPIVSFQLWHSFQYFGINRHMGGANDGKTVMDCSKRQKIANLVLKPVSTQAASSEECSLKVDYGKASEVEIQGKELQHGSLSCVPNDEVVNDRAEAMTELSGSTIFSKMEEKNEEHRDGEEQATVSTDKHSVSLNVASPLIRFIKGKGGFTHEEIERDLGVKIIFPSSKDEETVTVEGTSIERVTTASERIQLIIDEVVNSPKLDYSHFVSLPLAIHPELVDKLITFQNSVLGINQLDLENNLERESDRETSDDEDQDQLLDRGSNVAVELKIAEKEFVKVDITNIPLTSYPPKRLKSSNLSDLGIDKSIFIKPKTFHLTVLMLKLWNKERIDRAAQVLQSISSKVMDALENRPVSIRLKGLECMRGSFAKARVLYAPVEEIGREGRLERACQVIIDAFVEAGLVLEKDAGQKLKLHATVMNARHRKSEDRRKKYDSFDARGIVKQYGSEVWGEYLIREAHLSKRFVFDENGYYHCCASISFPESMQVD